MAGKTAPATQEAVLEPPTEELKDVIDETQDSIPKTEHERMLQEIKEQTKAADFAKYQKVQRTLAETQAEVRRLREASKQSPTSNTVLKGMLELAENEYGDNPKVVLLKQQLAQEEERMALETQKQQWEAFGLSERGKLDAKIRETGQDPDDPKFDTVYDVFEQGYYMTGPVGFEKAGKRLERILGSTTPSTPKPKESEDERIKRLAEEMANSILEEKGLLNTDVNLPSGASASDEEFMRKYGRGETDDHKRAFEILKKK